MKTEYTVRCTACGKELDDANLPLECDCGTPALIRADYGKKQIEVGGDGLGLYKFGDWLPLRRMLEGSAAPVTYKSSGLAGSLGLSDLWITFNGWWPEKGAYMKTGTFKECEAFTVCARMPEDFGGTLVVASAGNTARAFARVCSENDIPLVVVVPETYLDAMWFEEEIKPCVKLLAAGGNSDYFDAIHLSNLICNVPGYVPEGGAKNIARRDGMATTVLSAATTIGSIPEYYFQAVGSGTGAIAAWEANLRLLEDGRFGTTKMKLMVSQNAPFLLLCDSWQRKQRELVELDLETAAKQIEIINAKVLSNRKPPYSIGGGLFDALVDSDGETLSATNDEADEARRLFLEAEGIDISPAAGVACASLIASVRSGTVPKNALVMLNITGGGADRFIKEKPVVFMKPNTIIPREDIERKKIEQMLAAL
jgi:cysteate synthase